MAYQQFLREVIKYICYNNLWIAFAAALQYYSWNGWRVNYDILAQNTAFVFFGTCALYNAQRLFFKPYTANGTKDSRIDWVMDNQRHLKFWTFLSLMSCVVLVFSFDKQHWVLLALLTLLSIAYSYLPMFPGGLRRLGSLKAPMVALVWVGVCLYLGRKDLRPEWASVYLFFLLLLLCLMFDYRDRHRDKMKTPANFLSQRGFLILLIGVSLMLGLAHYLTLQNVGFTLIILGFIAALIYFNFRPKNDAIFYSFVVDGFLIIEAISRIIDQNVWP